MHPSAPYFFTCLTPGDFTHQWRSSAAKWVNSLLLNPDELCTVHVLFINRVRGLLSVHIDTSL